MNGQRSQRKNLKERIDKTAGILRKRYRDFAHHNRKNPFEELLFILCSVQTDEKKYRETFGALRRRFPRFEDLARGRRKDIVKARKRGLSPTKSRMVQGICRRIERLQGRTQPRWRFSLHVNNPFAREGAVHS